MKRPPAGMRRGTEQREAERIKGGPSASYTTTKWEELKVINNKFTREDRIETLESALDDLSRAMDSLESIKDYAGYADDLLDIFNDLQGELEELQKEAQREYTEMVASMTRDYWKAVL